eukprot:6196801-Pleurochrysis_carterae.AAC.1
MEQAERTVGVPAALVLRYRSQKSCSGVTTERLTSRRLLWHVSRPKDRHVSEADDWQRKKREQEAIEAVMVRADRLKKTAIKVCNNAEQELILFQQTMKQVSPKRLRSGKMTSSREQQVARSPAAKADAQRQLEALEMAFSSAFDKARSAAQANKEARRQARLLKKEANSKKVMAVRAEGVLTARKAELETARTQLREIRKMREDRALLEKQKRDEAAELAKKLRSEEATRCGAGHATLRWLSPRAVYSC